MNLANIVRFWARWDPDRVHLRLDGEDVTWAELDERTNRLANGLAAQGVDHGDRVGILAANAVEYCELAIACYKLGAVLVPLNVRLTPTELRYQLEHSGCRLAVSDQALAGALADAAAGLDVSRFTIGSTFDGLRAASSSDPDVPVAPDDLAYLCYTSGTTGQPKGAMLTHANVWNMAVMRILALGQVRDDRVYLPFPLAFTGGLVSSWGPAYVSGATLVLDRAVDPLRALQRIAGDRITVFAAVPVVWEMILHHPDFGSYDLSSLRIAGSGGAPVPPSLLTGLQAAGIPMSQGYGLTEGGGMNTWLRAEDATAKLGSAGIPMMHTRARIVDDTLRDVAVGTVGELLLKGPEVMRGYWGDPEETEVALVDGWLRTGDMARVDEDGYVTIVDRAKDMLISGGLNVYPAEVERVIAGVAGVADVAVIGLPDERWGEVAVALVTPAPGAELDEAMIVAHCSTQLADYKRPKRVPFPDEPLPRGMSGKVLKRELRLRYAHLGSTRATPSK